jgi:hypothetical protein
VQSDIAGALAKTRADLLERDMATALQHDLDAQRRSVARLRSLRAEHSLGLGFLDEPMTQATRGFDGLLFELALQRVVGKERGRQECGLCGKSPGGTMHARYCQAAGIKGHDTLVHNRVKRALRDICRQYLRKPVTEESHEPFMDSARPEYHIDLLLPAGAFALTGLDDQARQLPLMVDVSCVEVQCASHMRKSAEDPQRCCTERAATKLDHYSGFFNQDCYSLATMAVGSFGCIGAEGQGIIKAIAAEWAARESSLTAKPAAMAAIAVGRIRAALSAALHMGLSERVRAYLGTPGVHGSHGAGAGVQGRVYGWGGEEPEVFDDMAW